MKRHPSKSALAAASTVLAATLAQTPQERQAAHQQAQDAQRAAEERAGLISDQVVKGALEAIAKAFEGRKPCTAEQLAQHRWETVALPQLRSLGVPTRHCIRITDWHNPEQERKFLRLKELCCGKGAVVALCGARGTGKTTIACQLMRERVEAMLEFHRLQTGKEPFDPGRYEKLFRLGSMFKLLFSGFGGVNQEQLQGLYDAWVRLPFLVLDELHDAETVPAAISMLVDLIDRRYAERRDTVLISNRSAGEFQKEMNASIVSRLTEHGAILSCEWGSMRARK